MIPTGVEGYHVGNRPRRHRRRRRPVLAWCSYAAGVGLLYGLVAFVWIGVTR